MNPPLPEPVLARWLGWLDSALSPAYARWDGGGNLVEHGGDFDRYARQPRGQGSGPAGAAPTFLNAYLPADPGTADTIFRSARMPSGQAADLHVFTAAGSRWMLILPPAGRGMPAPGGGTEPGSARAGDAEILTASQVPRVWLNEPWNDVAAVLSLAAFERVEEGRFRPICPVPPWFRSIVCDFAGECLLSGELSNSAFLGHFLVEAEEFWKATHCGRLKSGLWSETHSGGHLEASALALGERKCLLIELQSCGQDDKQTMLQKARENALAHERLACEMEKNELLISCVVHDLAGPLTGMSAGLTMLSNESLSPTGQDLLQLALRSVDGMQQQIRDLLGWFSAGNPASTSQPSPSVESPSALDCARRVVRLMIPAFAEKRVMLRLSVPTADDDPLRVRGEAFRFERVLANLLENALRYSPEDTETIVALHGDGDFVQTSVLDQGPGVDPQHQGQIFQRYAHFGSHHGKAGLGLFSCRTIVERWGGSIGYSTRPEGGALFWVRLPRAQAPSLEAVPHTTHDRLHRSPRG
jgi:signal transduction histidine kinase